jgi:hypothetical protein
LCQIAARSFLRNQNLFMPTMRAAQITRPNGPFEIVERDIPQPAAGWVRIKVQACGICHSDSLVKEGHWPELHYPRVPGHMKWSESWMPWARVCRSGSRASA